MSQVVHGEEQTSRHGVPVRRVVHHAGVIAYADRLQVFLELIGWQQFCAGRLVAGGKFIHRQISRARNMRRAIVSLVVANVHDHQIRIGEMVGQPLRRHHQFRMGSAAPLTEPLGVPLAAKPPRPISKQATNIERIKLRFIVISCRRC